ncbi:DNA polymerase III subunit epsilon [Alsobacter metallidurans]|uniref:DNA polymerase III subunit epsilon n=1 Tax=Alsobacter metallidurans TaxID=340221 RepID=A0A917MJY7_9HYPH|nr:DNA polymerase III subunit epsilon [Alsobacter metallidurans]GGH33676.1 DNA polymerase III subunit epsilon [Alsobacter metallidurans]
MSREIVFDTETTGLSPLGGDRVVEIGCVELLNHMPTGQNFHVYINPERDMPQGAFAVHGLSSEFLSDKPVFAAIADAFVDFIGDAKLVAHNAAFDIGFLNAELGRLGHGPIDQGRVVDTLAIAKRKFPFAPASLDALCLRFGIDNSRRTKHGALLDAEILAEVYVELLGGRQTTLGLVAAGVKTAVERASARRGSLVRPEPLPSRLTAAEAAAHEAFIATLKGEIVWRRYLPEQDAAKAAS